MDFFRESTSRSRTAARNTIDLKIVLAFGIASFTILEVGANAATPVWVTLAMFGLNHLIEANSPEAREEERPVTAALRPERTATPEISLICIVEYS